MSDSPDATRRLQTQVNRGIAWSGASQAIIAIADLLSMFIVVVKLVPPEHYGIACGALALYPALDVAADLGVTASIIQRDDHSPEKLSTVFWFNLLVSLGLFAIVAVVGPLYAKFQHHPIIYGLLLAYGGKLLFQNVYAIPFALMKKNLQFETIAKTRIVAHLAESIARVVFAMLGYSIWCFTLAALCRVVIFGVVIQLRQPFIPKLVFRPREVADYISFGARAAASQLLYQVYVNLDYLFVLHYFGDVANGIYSFAFWLVLEPVRTISNVVSDVAFSTFARLRFDREKLIAQLTRFIRLNLMAVLPFIVIIALVVPDIFAMSSHAWTPAERELGVQAVRLLCLVGLLRALGFLGPPLLDGVGRPELTLRYMIVAAISVTAAFWICAHVFAGLGLISIALGWTIAYPVAFVVLAIMVVRQIQLPMRAFLNNTVGIAACSAAGFVVGLGVSMITPMFAPLLRLTIIAGASLATTALLLITWQRITPRSIRASMAD